MKAPIWVALVSFCAGFIVHRAATNDGAERIEFEPVSPTPMDGRPATPSIELASVPDRSPVVVDVPTFATAPADPIERHTDEINRLTHAIELARLRAALDECRNGTFSPIGNAHALPEWPELDAAQRREVDSFLESFPVLLTAGEAKLIATHTFEGGDRIADLIRMLGRERVLAAMQPEARDAMQRDDPERFADYFGAPPQ